MSSLIKTKLLRTLPLWLSLPLVAPSARAESNAPTYLAHSGLVAAVASANVNIALHKAVLSGAIRYVGPGPDNANATEHPENAFDGDDSTSTGKTGNVTVDLGAVYVVDRVVVKFASAPNKYSVAWSPYMGTSNLPPTYDLTTGLGHVPEAESANQEYRDVAWLNDVQKVDDRKLPAQPTRFLNFHFNPIYNGSWTSVSISEIEVYGYPYVGAAGDHAYLSRKNWVPTGYADAAPNGEGPTIGFSIDGGMTNPWRPQTDAAPGQWFQVDLGASVSFDQIDVLFAIGAGVGAASSINVFASDDPTSWGAPIASLAYGESATSSFPLQTKRYLKLEQTASVGGWWQVDELNLLAPVVVGLGASGSGGQAGSPTVGGGGVGGIAGHAGNAGTADTGLPGGTASTGGGVGNLPQGSAGALVNSSEAPKASAEPGSCQLLRPRSGGLATWTLISLTALAVGLRRGRRQAATPG